MSKSFLLQIERVNFRGEGIGKSEDGMVFRVSNALAGECVEVLDASTLRRKLAYLLNVVEPCSEAVVPLCSHWRDCAACQFMRMKIETQQAQKREHWLRLIGRFVSIEQCPCVNFESANLNYNYRHRARARFHGGAFVMPVRADAQTILDQCAPPCDSSLVEDLYSIETSITLHDCCLHATCLNDAMHRLELIFAKNEVAELFEYDIEAFDHNIRVTLFASPDCVEQARAFASKIAQSVANTCDEGMSIILQPVPPHGSHVYPPAESYGISPWYGYTKNQHGQLLYSLKGSWTPVNPTNADKIREILIRMFNSVDQRVERVLELGCGCGTHADVFDRPDIKYHGIDASWPAIQSAQYNAKLYQWDNHTFQTSTALHYLDKNYYKGARADLVLMHSNRLPYGEDVARWCKKFGAHTILVVAPTAYAMAAECQHFAQIGYDLKALTLCDTLPYTYHMMAVAKLVLKE